jgi:ElaB/YqjD/DUF883 family membrane-anchored ribosome-binding protein
MAFIAPIEKIVSKAKAAFSKLESEIKIVVGELDTFSHEEAHKLAGIFEDGFARVRRWFSQATQYFVAKIKSVEKRKHQSKVGPNASSFKAEIVSALHNVERLVDDVIKGLRDSARAFIHEAKDIITKLKAMLEKIEVDAVSGMKKAGEDAYRALHQIATDAIRGLQRFAASFTKTIEADARFAYQHKSAIATAALIGFANPIFIICFAASFGILIGADKFNP